MRRLFAIGRDLTGNLPPMPGVYPDMPAPIVRVADGMRELALDAVGHAGDPPQSTGPSASALSPCSLTRTGRS